MLRWSLFTVLVLAFFAPASRAQEAALFQDEAHILYRNEVTAGVTIHNNGWGVAFRRGNNITRYKKFVFEAEAVGMKHPKEFRTINPYFDNAKAYYYGKQNAFFVLRTGGGIQKIIYSKGDRGTIEMRFNLSGGLSLGLLKPVYLNILIPTGVPYEFEVATHRYDPRSHYVDNIYGRAPFKNGLDEMKMKPGLYTKFGFSFEYGAYDDDIKSVEVGAALDAYPDAVPLMALIDNKKMFLSFYISLYPFGKRW